MADLKNVIYLSNEDYETLVTTGTVTIGGDTLTYDETNNIYVTPEETASATNDGLMSAADKAKLDGIAPGAEANVQSDWNVTDSSSDAFIKNKPTIPTVNNGTLTIQKNGASVATFSANQSTAITANITVPTNLDDISDGSTRKLADYLLKTAKAADSDKLDGHDSSYFQTALSTQTAYSAKGSATKVPQITTNNLGQVTGITEVAITDHNDNQTVKVGSTTFTANAAVSFTGSGAASVSANSNSNTITITVPTVTDTNYYHSTGSWNGLTYTATNNGGAPTLSFTIPTGTSANTVAVGNHTHGYYTKPTGGIPGSDLAENYYIKPASGIPSSDLAETYVLTSSVGTAASKNYTTTVASGNADVVTSGAVYTAINNLTDKHHTGGGWNGLSYTLTGQGGATTFTITIPTGTSATSVAVGNHTHNNYVDLSSDQNIDGVKTFLERPLAKDTYTAIEYLESDATTPFPYIRTGIQRNIQYTGALSCVLDGYFTKTQTLGFNGYDSGGQLGQSNGKWSTESSVSSVSALTRTTILQVMNFTSNYDRLYQKNNDTYTQIATRAIGAGATYATQADYSLFVAYNGTYTYKPAALRLYSFKMYQGDYYTSPSTCVLLRNFVPVKDAHGVAGLLDLVENKFYFSESAGEFIAGEATGNSYELSTQLLTSGDVAAVALTNSYNSLDNKPNIPSVSNSTITIAQTGTPTNQTFTLNGSAKTINLGYTISAASTNGAIKIEPNGGTTYTVVVPGLQAGAFTGTTTTVASGNNNLVTSDAVYNAIDALPAPMIFKGTLGTNGTITSLPTATAVNEGYTYKVITTGTYAGQAAKEGDVFTSNGSSWVLIPSGDETDSDTWREIKVNGVSFLGSSISSGAVNFTHGANVTISTGSNGAITIAATDTTYSNASTTAAGLMSSEDKIKLNGIATGAEVNVQSDWAETDTADDAYIQNKPYLGQQIIVLEDNGSTTAGTWLAKTDAITTLAAGQIFLYKVTVAGASTTKLNITCSGTATGAKTIYRMGSTKLTTHYIVGEYILLYFDGTYFKVVNDYDANSDTKVRQYQKGGTSTLTGDKYPLLAKYTNASTTTYVASYANYWNDTYLDADTGELYVNNKQVATVDDVPTTLDDISDGFTRALSKYLPRSGGTANPLTGPVYINHADLSFIGTAGGFGFRAAAQSGQSVPHLGQINLSKNFGGDGNQYGIQMSAVDITNNKFNQFRVYQSGIAYQQYNNASGTTTNVFTVDTTGMLKTLSDIYEGGTKLSDKYLGINDKAADSDKLDGHDSTYFQPALSTQTAYSAKGSATKVPQITTNNLGQVTGITEITITDTGATSVTVSGSGNVVSSGSYNASSRTIALTKGVTAITAHQGIKSLNTNNTTSQTVNADETIAGSGSINLHKVAKTGDYNDLVNQPDIPEPVVEITYSALKTLRDNSQLVPGTWYRVTDYQCTTVTENTHSAEHTFDVLVIADSNNKLNEKARAVLHAGDTYFANNNLEAWQIWYCLDNDRARFDWADNYGIVINNVIYVRDPSKDDITKTYGYAWLNGIHYRYTNTDNPTAKTKAYDSQSGGTEYSISSIHQEAGKGIIYRMIDEFDNDVPYDFKNILFTKSGQYTNAYTFSYTDSTIKDASLFGFRKLCYNNIIKKDTSGVDRQRLNFNVFYTMSGVLCCYSNMLGDNCFSNTFGYMCHSNIFSESCYSNIFRNYCYSNIFGPQCYSNTFKDYCQFNTFGYGCQLNKFRTGCSYNKLGNGCRSITFGSSSLLIDYVRYIVVDNGCCYLDIKSTDTIASDSNYLQNVHIHLGVKGASLNSRKTITIPDRNLPYETNVYMDTDGNIKMVINTSMIWDYTSDEHKATTEAQILTYRYLTIYDDYSTEATSAPRPTNATGFADPDVYFYSTGITVADGDTDIALSYPSQGGVLGLQIDIDDLTQLNN